MKIMRALRAYQEKIKNDIYGAWNSGAKNVMAVLPTGGGKTVVIGRIAQEVQGVGVAIAHRQELVSQISTALAREEIRHSVIAQPATIRSIRAAHIEETGRDWIHSAAQWHVAGVDTLLKRSLTDTFRNSVAFVVQDEGHHVLRENKWGRAQALFPHARGLFPTATPLRADGKGLGSHHDGLADVLVEGPGMRELIELGYLTDYEIYCPKVEDLDLSGVDVSTTTGDLNYDQLRKATHKSKKLVGNVVEHYLRYARGKLGITFAVDVESAAEIAEEYRRNGVPAEVVSAKTPDDLRRSILRRFKAREVLQLVNVDLFGEGFDLPAIEVVSMARGTASFSLYCQQFGRALRLMISQILMAAWESYSPEQRKGHIAASGKPKAIIIDHVGNVIRHNGPPDRPRIYSLDRRGKRGSGATDDAIPLRVCGECAKPYERTHVACPFCGAEPPAPPVRTGPEFVDGDLQLLTPEVIAQMWGNVAELDAPMVTGNSFMDRARLDTQRMQKQLRHAIDCWAGHHSQRDDRENHKHFWFTFGMTVPQACVLRPKDATELRERIAAKLLIDGVTIPDLEYATPNTY